MAYLSSRSKPSTADCDNGAILLPRLGSAMMMDDGAARSGRRTAGPHACPAAPASFMREDGWREATLSDQFPTDHGFLRDIFRRPNKYGIPLETGYRLISFGVAAGMVPVMQSYRDDTAALNRLCSPANDHDQHQIAALKLNVSQLRVVLSQMIDHWRLRLRSGDWVASAPVGGVGDRWVPLDKVAWIYDQGTTIDDWFNGRATLCGERYFGLYIRPVKPMTFDRAALAFGDRSLVDDYLREYKEISPELRAYFKSELRSRLLNAVASGEYLMDGIKEGTAERRPVTTLELEPRPMVRGPNLLLATGDLIRCVRVYLPNPFGPAVAGPQPQRLPESHVESSTPAPIALPADDRKSEAKPNPKRMPKDANDKQGGGDISKPIRWSWSDAAAEAIRLSLRNEFPADKTGQRGKLNDYWIDKCDDHPDQSTFYGWFQKNVPDECSFDQYKNTFTKSTQESVLKSKHKARIWGHLIKLAQWKDAKLLSHDDIVGHLAGFCLAEIKYRPFADHLSAEVDKVWPQSRNVQESIRKSRRRNRSTAA